MSQLPYTMPGSPFQYNLPQLMPQQSSGMGMLTNPWLQMGAGILGSAGRGVPGITAIGRGMTTGMQNLAVMKEQEERAKERKFKAERFKMEMERLRKEAEQQAEMQQRAQEAMKDDPELQRAWALGGQDLMNEVYSQRMKPAKQPMSFQEFQLAQSDPAFARFLEAKRKASGTKVTVENVLPQLNKAVQTDIQRDIVSGSTAIPEAQRTLEMVQNNPGQVGMLARGLEKLSGVVKSTGQTIGSDTITGLGDAIRPEGDVSPTTIQSGLLATKTAARQIMAPDKGPLTAQEQADYKEALGMLESSDADIVADGLESLIGVMDRRMTKLKQMGRISGTSIPGEMNMPRPMTAADRDALPSGTRYIAPNGKIMVKK